MSFTLSKTSSVIQVVVSTLGTGILFMPASFKLLGYTYAIGVLLFVGFLTFFTLYSLAYSAVIVECHHNASYPKVASLFSKYLRWTVDLAMIGSNLGSCVYIIQTLCKSTANMLILFGLNVDFEILRKSVLVLFALIVWYIGSKDDLSSLAFMSKVSLAGVFYYLGLTIYYALFHGQALSQLDTKSQDFASGFIKFVFAMHCQFSFLSIFNQMEDKSLGSVSFVCMVSAAIITVIYMSSGFFGYKAVGNSIGSNQILEVYGDRTGDFMQNIMQNTFDKKGILPGIAQGFFLFIWVGFLCFATSPCIPIIQSYLPSKGKPIRKGFVALAIATILLLAGLPSSLRMNALLDISAAIFTTPLSFVFPSIFMICVTRRFSVLSLTSYALILFSAFVCAMILYGVFTKW